MDVGGTDFVDRGKAYRGVGGKSVPLSRFASSCLKLGSRYIYYAYIGNCLDCMGVDPKVIAVYPRVHAQSWLRRVDAMVFWAYGWHLEDPHDAHQPSSMQYLQGCRVKRGGRWIICCCFCAVGSLPAQIGVVGFMF